MESLAQNVQAGFAEQKAKAERLEKRVEVVAKLGVAQIDGQKEVMNQVGGLANQNQQIVEHMLSSSHEGGGGGNNQPSGASTQSEHPLPPRGGGGGSNEPSLLEFLSTRGWGEFYDVINENVGGTVSVLCHVDLQDLKSLKIPEINARTIIRSAQKWQ